MTPSVPSPGLEASSARPGARTTAALEVTRLRPRGAAVSIVEYSLEVLSQLLYPSIALPTLSIFFDTSFGYYLQDVTVFLKFFMVEVFRSGFGVSFCFDVCILAFIFHLFFNEGTESIHIFNTRVLRQKLCWLGAKAL